MEHLRFKVDAGVGGNVGMMEKPVTEVPKEPTSNKGRRGRHSSILPSSPRLLFSKWLSSVRKEKESGEESSFECAPSFASHKREVNRGRESGCRDYGASNSPLGGYLTQVIPEIDQEGRDLEKRLAQKRFRKTKCVRLPRPRFRKKIAFGDQPPPFVNEEVEHGEFSPSVAVNSSERFPATLMNFREADDDSEKSILICSKSTQTVDSSGDPFLSFGFGLGLAFLVANRRNEYDKMEQLHRETEALLKEIKHEMRKREDYGYSRTVHPLAYPVSGSNRPSDQFRKTVSSGGSAKQEEICQMEAEFVAELELLQLNVDSENSEIPCQRQTEVVEDAEGSPSVDFVEQDNHEENMYGICPYELERRLHELLETRQEERIVELESALKQADCRLREQELEISRWKESLLCARDQHRTRDFCDTLQ